MSNRRWPGAGSWLGHHWRHVAWRVVQLGSLALFGYAAWQVLGHLPYRIDIEVYRMGGQQWLDGAPLYTGNVMFHTQIGLDLPFTYPPLAAIVFSPFAWMPFPVASVAITCTTLVLLVASTVIVLTRLDFWPDSAETAAVTSEPSWQRRIWLALVIVALAMIYLEPIRANFDFGQINVVLMTLVIADCVPRRTPWPRGILVGLAIALKLTPAVFLLYFLLRRDGRAAITAVASFVVATLVGFLLAWRDSWEYWTHTLGDTGRIGSATLNTNQNIAGALARLELGDGLQFVLWTTACFAALGLTVWATRRVLRATESGAESLLALCCIALFGLVVSPVSWSHHWVWVLPTLMVTTVLAYRRRNAALAVLTLAGIALLVWTPIDLMPKHHEASASWWRQLVGGSYVWWALILIAVAGLTVTSRVSPPRTPESGQPAGREPAAPNHQALRQL
jgi:alpha-1,2-mannosyltransferase